MFHLSCVTCHLSLVTFHQRQKPHPQTHPLLSPPLCTDCQERSFVFGYQPVCDKCLFSGQMNIKISKSNKYFYLWVYWSWNIIILKNILIFQCGNSKNSTNEYANIFVAVNSNKNSYEWIYLLRNIRILKYIQIFFTH